MKYLRRFWALYLITAMIFTGMCMYGSKAVTAMVESLPIERSVTFVIDPGHGGEDGGAVSCTGHKESQINLSIALRLNDLLHLLGYDTVMIRRTDESIYTQGNTIASQKVSDLNERVRIVNETPGAILISIHQNTYADSRYRGAQVFYGKDDQSKEIAQTLQRNIINILNPSSHRKSKQAKGVFLMENITAPGVLIECAFLTNPEEEALIRDASYQMKLCAVISGTISSYLTDT
jgi:N-acetylmuramoyl-L-alanine amidase